MAAAPGPPARSAEKTLVVVNDVTDPVSLDPHREFDASSENVINHIFDGLVRMDANGAIGPALAESWRRLDDYTVEFKLRKGVTFHNGEPFNSEAVRFSLARQLDPKNPAPNSVLLDTVKEAETVDDYTVRIKTKVPDGILLNKLPLFFRVLPPKYLQKVGDEEFARHPVGTGPFVFERWTRGDSIELKANPDYWMSGSPKIRRLVFRFLPLEKQMDALLNGTVDVITDLSGLDTLKVAQNPSLQILKAKNFYAVSVIINSRKAPFSDVRLRQALAHAIDRQALIRYGARGNALPLNTLSMPGEFGHDTAIDAAKFDPALAHRLLKDAGIQGPLRIKAMVREEVKSFGKIIFAELEKAGFKTEYTVVSQKDVYEKVVIPNTNPKIPQWDGDLFVSHYVDPTAHVYFPYNILVYSKGGYSLANDPEFDKLFTEMTMTTDRTKQASLCHELEELNSKKLLAISFVQVVRPFGLRKNVVYEPQITGMLDFRQADIISETGVKP